MRTSAGPQLNAASGDIRRENLQSVTPASASTSSQRNAFPVQSLLGFVITA